MGSKSRFLDYVSIYGPQFAPRPAEDSRGANDITMTMITFTCKQNGVACSGITRKTVLACRNDRDV